MYKIYMIFIAFFVMLLTAEANENYIVLTSEKTSGDMEYQQSKYYNLLKHNDVIHTSFSTVKFQDVVETVNNTYILKIGPFKSNNTLSLVYLTLKESFPLAFILEEEKSVLTVVPETKIVEKKVYVTKEVIVEKEDDTLWLALFGLATIGILFMFLSSDKIRRLKEEHEKIKLKHKKLEQKQHEVLSSMGENIHTIAKETMNHTSILAEKVKATSLESDMAKVIYSENELLDVTSDLIKFLRLKSHKVVIQNEVFNFNNVLNEVTGMLHNTYKQNDTELVFDIDKDVPRFMLADSLHLGQILTNLLEYFIQHSQSKEIKLEVTSLSSLKEGLQLQFQIDGDLVIENKETLFDSYYDEETRRYIGLGLFVAKELTDLMEGELSIIDANNGRHSLMLTLPIEEKNKEKRKYRLPHKNLVGKKILIVDKSRSAAIATEKLFAYFKAEVKILTVEHFRSNTLNFALYDIVMLTDSLFNFKTIEALKKVKKEQELKIISLDNLFSSGDGILNNAIDISLKKPLNQEYVFDTLVELYKEKEKEKETVNEREEVQENKKDALLVYRDKFKDVSNVTLESFQKFQGSHILIVEDNIINQKVVLSVLAKSGMKLSIANNGEEAVKFMRHTSEAVDFIFMDINMPVMDGYRATELIRNDNRFDNVAIVSLTALVSEHEIEKMFDSGMNGYLPKPVKIDKLYSALDTFLTAVQITDIPLNVEKVVEMNLDGLSIEEGLQHMKGNTMFYKEVLKEFVDAYTNSDVLFEKLVKEHRFTQVKMLCLDMKGLTGTIGAKDMHRVINEIHQHLIYKKPELLHSYTSKYREEFLKLIKSINTYLSA